MPKEKKRSNAHQAQLLLQQGKPLHPEALVGWRITFSEPQQGIAGGIVVKAMYSTGAATRHLVMRLAHRGYIVVNLKRKPERSIRDRFVTSSVCQFKLEEHLDPGPTKRGFVHKRALKSGKNWRKRYFMINPYSGALYYYRSDRNAVTATPRGVFELCRPNASMQVRLLEPEDDGADGRLHVVEVYSERSKDNRMIFAASGAAVADSWVTALEEAIAHAGPGARPGAIQSAAEALCEKRKISPPSKRAVRTRLNLPMEVTDIASYTGMNTDYAIDMSPLDVAVDGPDNIPYHAVLTAFIDVSRGIALAHVVTADRPTADDILQLVTEAAEKTSSASPARASLVTYRSAPIDDPRTKAQLRSLGIAQSDVQVDSRRPGLALTAMFGTKLGRVPLNPRRNPSIPFAIRETLPLPVVRPAVALLLERYHAGLQINREAEPAVPAAAAIQAITKGPVKSTPIEFAYARPLSPTR